MDSATRIRQKEAQNANQNTPDVDADRDGSSSSSSSIPLPAISKKHLLIIGAIVAIAILWKLSKDDDGGQPTESLEEAREQVKDEQTVEANPDNIEQPRIEVPNDPNDPLAADTAVITALRNNGILGGNT